MKFAADYALIGEMNMGNNIFVFFIMIFLSACNALSLGGDDVQYVKDPLNPNRQVTVEDAKKSGKLDFFKLSSKDKKPDGYQEKNYFLWSACLDVLSDLPTRVSDSYGGIYTTDFVENNQGHLQAIQCRVVGEKVLSKNLLVQVFTKKVNSEKVIKSDHNALKSSILLRAKELKAQYDDAV